MRPTPLNVGEPDLMTHWGKNGLTMQGWTPLRSDKPTQDEPHDWQPKSMSSSISQNLSLVPFTPQWLMGLVNPAEGSLNAMAYSGIGSLLGKIFGIGSANADEMPGGLAAAGKGGLPGAPGGAGAGQRGSGTIMLTGTLTGTAQLTGNVTLNGAALGQFIAEGVMHAMAKFGGGGARPDFSGGPALAPPT
jgi:hypothetical protein